MDANRRFVGPLAALALLLCLPASASAGPVPTGEPTYERSGRTLKLDRPGSYIGDVGTPEYDWVRCTGPGAETCSPNAVGTGTSYLLTSTDIGFRIRLRETVRDLLLDPTTQLSSDAGPVAARPPRNEAPPAVTGTPRRGLLLASTLGTWSDPSPANVSYSRQWLRCTSAADGCTAVPGATEAAYSLGSEDVGRFMRVRVKATGLGSAEADSASVGPVEDLTASGDPPPEQPPSGGPGAPSRSPRAKRLRPFPLVIVTGRVRRGGARIFSFVVRGPTRAKVHATCRGRGCAFRSTRRTIGRAKKLRLRRAQGFFRSGAIIEVRVTGRNRIGKFTRIRIRRGRAPARVDLCLQPGARRPSPCSR